MDARSETIELRRWTDGDRWVLERTVGDPAAMAHLGGIETPAQIAARHERLLRQPPGQGMFTIRLGPDARVAGTIGVWESRWRDEAVYETGWFVLPEFQRRGIASRAALAIVERATALRKHRALHAFPSVDNVASNAVCRRAGFTCLGEFDVEYPKGRTMRCNDWFVDVALDRRRAGRFERSRGYAADMTTTFITGCSRGLGLGLARRFATLPDAHLYAAARDPEGGELGRLVAESEGRVTPVALDVGDPASIARAARVVAEGGRQIDTLINGAGVANRQAFGEIELADFMAILETNVAGPVLVTQAMRPALRRGSKVINVGSRAGSIDAADGTGGLAYPASKAALNMITKQLAAVLADDGITVLSLHPGWVRTDLGGANARLGIDESVDGMMAVIAGLKPEQTGTFLQWNGEPLPW